MKWRGSQNFLSYLTGAFLLLIILPCAGNTQSDGLYGEASTAKGTGVYGFHKDTTNYGYLASSDAGVFGFHKTTTNSGSLGNSFNGVYGESTTTQGSGVYGYHKNIGNYGYLGGDVVGAYGFHKDTENNGFLGGDFNGAYGESTTDKGSGVYGYHVKEGNYGYLGGDIVGVFGFNKKTGNIGYLGDTEAGVYGDSASLWAGYFNGKVHVNGALSKGSGTFVQPHAKDPSKEINYAFFEGPEHAVFLRGTAKLNQGSAVIELPEHFRVVAAREGLQVQVTPHSADTFGLAVVERGRERIAVKELRDGRGNFTFDYFITAVRAGFEGHEPVTANTHFTPRTDETAGEFEARYSRDDMTSKAIRGMLISNGILTEQGKLNMAKVKELGWDVKDKNSSIALSREKRFTRK
jgi:hypothetical protein